jgi:hypothetical protein
VRGELVADLDVQLLGEAGCGHGISWSGGSGSAGLGQAAFASFFLETFLPSTRTSLRFLTVYPAGSVPSFSIRSGQRPHADLDAQHSSFGSLRT